MADRPARSRAVAPLVVSTAADFQRERVFLQEHVFPEIDGMFRQRGSAFAPLDLYGDVDEEFTDDADIVQMSLDYVRRCAPFFVCLLGERYGIHRAPLSKNSGGSFSDIGASDVDSLRCPSGFPAVHGRRRYTPSEAVRSVSGPHRWLRQSFLQASENGGYSWVLNDLYEACSVMELQIIQAAFLNTCEHCFFYFRVAGHVESLCEGLTEAEEAAVRDLYAPESDFAATRVQDLKQRIVKRGLNVKYFASLPELRQHLVEDFRNLLRQLPSPDFDLEWPDSLQLRDHAAFAEERCQVFVPNIFCLTLAQRLAKFAEPVLEPSTPPPPLTESVKQFSKRDYSQILQKTYDKISRKQVIVEKRIALLTGDRGSGKTAFVANWIANFRKSRPQAVVLEHFVGATTESHDLVKTLERLTQLLRTHFDLKSHEHFQSPKESWQSFNYVCQSLEAALHLGGTLIVIDGLDCIGRNPAIESDLEKVMDWLPAVIPSNVRFLFSANGSDLASKGLSKREDVEVIQFNTKMSLEEDISQMKDFASHSGCVLDQDFGEDFLLWPLRSCPLAQQLLLQEQRCLGKGERWDSLSLELFETQSLRDMLTRLLRRWMGDLNWAKFTTAPAEPSEKSLDKEESSKRTDWDGWISDLLSLLCTTRRGLPVSGLVELLMEMGYYRESTVTAFDVFSFLNTASCLIQLKDNRVCFTHLHFKEICDHAFLGNVTNACVETRCRETDSPSLSDTRHRLHVALAEYYLRCNEKNEALYHFDRASEYNRLCLLLVEPRVIMAHFDPASIVEKVAFSEDFLFYWSCAAKEGRQPERRLADRIEKVLGILVPPPGDPSPKPAPIPSTEITIGEECLVTPSTARAHSKASGVLEIPDSYRVPDLSVSDGSYFEFMSQCSESEFGDEPLSTEESVDFGIAAGNLFACLCHFEQASVVMKHVHNIFEQTGPACPNELLKMVRIQFLLGLHLANLGKEAESGQWMTAAIDTANIFLLVSDLDESDRTQQLLLALKGRALLCASDKALQRKDLAAAERILREAEGCAQRCRSTTLRSATHRQRALLQQQSVELAGANSHLETAVFFTERWFGPNHPDVASLLVLLAQLRSDPAWKDGFDLGTAGAFYRRACHIRSTALTANHVLLADAMAALGGLLTQENYRSSLQEAHGLLTKALDIRLLRLGPDHDAVKNLLLTLRHLETRLGRLQRLGWPSSPSSTSSSCISSSSFVSVPSRPPSTASRSSLKSRPSSVLSCNFETSFKAREKFLFETTFLSSLGGRSAASLFHTMQGPRSSLEADLREEQTGRELRAALEQNIQFKSAWYNLPGGRRLPACLRTTPLRPTTAKPRRQRSGLEGPPL